MVMSWNPGDMSAIHDHEILQWAGAGIWPKRTRYLQGR